MLALAFAVAIFGAALWITSANADIPPAVSANGLFELDANVEDLPVGAPTDWEVICKEYDDPVSNAACSGVAGSSGAFQKLFITDDPDFTGTSDDQPATGSTKDVLDIDQWDCKLANISPPKNDMLHAGAAVFDVPHHAGTDRIIYFFLDRQNSDNGNANVGFWFMQGAKSCPAVAGGGAVNWDADKHEQGDILATSAFTGGGGVSEILVFVWCSDPAAPDLKCGDSNSTTPPAPGSGDGPLQLIRTGADCRPIGGGTLDPLVCATVNRGGVKAGGGPNGDPAIPADDPVSPIWPYAGAGNPETQYEPGALFEGGINITALGLDIGCGGTFLANTRSSQSPTAQLHDFSVGQLSFCDSSIVTTPVDDDGVTISGNLSIGTGSVTVEDSALLTVNGVPTFGGTVTFFICGPTVPASTALCTTGGEQVGQTVLPNTSTSPKTVTSGDVVITQAGRYCFRADYTGDPQGVPAASDSAATECFIVDPVQPTLTTLASPLTAVALGQAVNDSATLSGTANQPGSGGGAAPNIPSVNPSIAGAAAGGTITFTLVKSDCSTVATGTGTNPQNATVSGDNTYGPVSFTPDAPGVYHWKAQYSGSSPNTLGTLVHNALCDVTNERVEVQRLQPSMTTAQRFLPNDSATITVGELDGALTGSVFFELFTNSTDCTADTGQPAYAVTRNIVTDAVGTPTDYVRTVSTLNTTVLVEATAAVSWRVTYTNTNPAHFGIAASCHENSTLTIANGGSVNTPPAE